MVETAQSSTLVIANIPDSSLKPAFQSCFYDNICVIDEDHTKLDRIRTIITERAERAGVVFSENFSISSRIDFLGVVMDLGAKLVSVRTKTIDKLKVSWENREKWTCKNFAGHVSTLQYCSTILRFELCNVFDVLKCYARMCSKLALGNLDWEDPFTVWPSVVDELTSWTLFCLANTPATPRRPGEPYNHVLVTDACPVGLGAIHWCLERNKVSFTQFLWPPGFTAEYSSHFETHAAKLCIFTFLKQGVPDNLCLASDNNSTVAAFNHRRSSIFAINQHVREVVNAFPNLNIKAVHIKGEHNIYADGLSRDKGLNVSADTLRQHMAMAVGGVEPCYGKNNNRLRVGEEEAPFFCAPQFLPSFASS
jgi:hypothetical protein